MSNPNTRAQPSKCLHLKKRLPSETSHFPSGQDLSPHGCLLPAKPLKRTNKCGFSYWIPCQNYEKVVPQQKGTAHPNGPRGGSALVYSPRFGAQQRAGSVGCGVAGAEAASWLPPSFRPLVGIPSNPLWKVDPQSRGLFSPRSGF